MRMIGAIRRLVLDWVKHAYRRAWLLAMRPRNARLSAEAVFDRIYRVGAWGGSQDELSSGFGSRGRAVDLYVDAVGAFIHENAITSIVGLGCGDFYVGSKVVQAISPGCSYLGVDVARVVIDRN